MRGRKAIEQYKKNTASKDGDPSHSACHSSLSQSPSPGLLGQWSTKVMLWNRSKTQACPQNQDFCQKKNGHILLNSLHSQKSSKKKFKRVTTKIENLFLDAVRKMALWLKHYSVPSSANESSATLSLASVPHFIICTQQDLQESIQNCLRHSHCNNGSQKQTHQAFKQKKEKF